MKRDLFADRRKEFMRRMDGGIAVFASNPRRARNHDVEYEYRQDSDFYYLTGFEEPGAVCVLAPGYRKYEYVLFVRPRDREKETWNGYRAGIEGAIQDHHAEMAFENDRMNDVLAEMMENAPALYYCLNRYPEVDEKIFRILENVRSRHRVGIYPPSKIVDPAEFLSEMRLIKTEGDLELLQKAVDISAKAHSAAMRCAAPLKHEYEIQAVLEYVFRANGSPRNGYGCIVGSGPNSCILHYRSNNRQMQSGELLLVDAGAEYGYYTGDITRTYPVNGRFSPQQRAVYAIVLTAQKKAIAAACPENTFMDVHDIAVRELTAGMISLGLLSGTVQKNIEERLYERYYMHRTSHWLGMDVHDAGKYKKDGDWRKLEPGMVLTVEPGIYIPPDDDHAEFRSIGVRIEDDVLITAGGSKVLSDACPKEIAEIESIVGSWADKRFFE